MDGKKHLSIEGLSGATGMKTLANAIGTAAPSGDAEKKPGKGGKGKTNKKEGEKETTPPKAETGYGILFSCSLYVLLPNRLLFLLLHLKCQCKYKRVIF